MTFTKLLTVYAAGAAIILVGWVLNVGQLYWMAGALLLLPQASRLFAQLEHRGLTVTRHLPHAAHQGEAVQVRLRAENALPIPKLHLSLMDELPKGLSTVEVEPVPVHLPPKSRDEAVYTLQLRRRGAHIIPRTLVHSTDLMGLHEVWTGIELVSQILVYPRVVDLPAHVLPPEWGGGQAPLDVSRRQGEGSSFFGIREYRPGDPLRHVHWRTAARWGQLAVVEWEAEESTDALLAVETLRGSERDLGPGSTLDVAAGMAASLAAAILSAGDSVRIAAPGATQWRAMPYRGPDALPDILEAFARMTATSDTPLAAELRQVAPHLAPGTLICWLAPEPDDRLLSTARYLRGANFRVIVYALSDTDAALAAWEAAAAELHGIQVPLTYLRAGDELVQRLLS
jgi:uncharacterized protein (DUF58 family)